MKTTSTQQRIKRFTAAAVAVALSGIVHHASADSPVGDWDLYFSGAQKGVALLTFYPDYTVLGLEVHSSGTLPKRPDDNPRGGDTDTENPRGIATDSGPNTFHCGSTEIAGTWGYGENGKLVGSLILYSANATNGWSFTGVAKTLNTTKPKITLSVTRSDSGLKSVMHGVLRAPLRDISGNYSVAGSAVNRINGYKQAFTQVLGISSPSVEYPSLPNVFNVFEAGPGYEGGGFAILTGNNYIGIYSEHVNPLTGSTNFIVLSGKFNTNTLRGSLSGYDADKLGIKAKLVNFPLSP